MEGGDAGEARAPRAGRRARQAQMVQEEQEVGGTPVGAGEERPSRERNSRGTPTQSRPVDPPDLQQPAGPEDDAAPAASRRHGFADMGDAGPPPAAPPPSSAVDRMAAGAGADGKKFTGVSRRKQEQEHAAQEAAARAKDKYEDRAGPDGVMDIPELEEEGKEDLSRVVAAAPRVRANKIQGMEELDGDSQYHLPAQQNRDIDLSILTAVLLASDMVYEPDEVWHHELLLSQVAAEMNADRDKGQEPEGKMSDPNLVMV